MLLSGISGLSFWPGNVQGVKRQGLRGFFYRKISVKVKFLLGGLFINVDSYSRFPQTVVSIKLCALINKSAETFISFFIIYLKSTQN